MNLNIENLIKSDSHPQTFHFQNFRKKLLFKKGKKTGESSNKTKVNTKNKGQAIVEYVLILTVVVVVMGGLLLKLNKGLRDWGKSILGNQGYIACLMQTGTLPGMAHSSCSIKNLNVNFSSSSSTETSSTSFSSSGTPTSDNSGGGGGTDPSDTDGSSPTTEEESDFASSNDDSSDGNNSSSSRSKNKGHNPTGQLISLNSSEGMDNEDGFGEEGNMEGEETAGGSSRKKRKMGFRDNLSSSNSKPGGSGQRLRAIQSYGYMLADQQEQKKRNTPIAIGGTGIKKKNIGEKEKTNYLVIKGKSKTKDQDDKIEKWSFGNIFRIFLIICIIVAVVLIIGSQATQVKKSMK